MPSQAMCLCGVPSRGRVPPQEVYSPADGIEVIGIHAASVPTGMVEVKFGIDRADEQQPRDDMSVSRFAFVAKLSIALPLFTAHPIPAAGLRIWLNELKKAVKRTHVVRHAYMFDC